MNEDQQIKEQPLGYEAREFLREIALDQEVSFQIKFTINKFDYGLIIVDKGQKNLNVELLKHGFA